MKILIVVLRLLCLVELALVRGKAGTMVACFSVIKFLRCPIFLLSLHIHYIIIVIWDSLTDMCASTGQ